ncbi:MAG: 16S rRNA (guanine(527)-N(7))-methyltransferase RsmG [Pseudomonadota bacterium]
MDAERARVIADFDVSRETLTRLDRVVATLDAWRGRFNLIGPREWPRLWGRHIADSLQLAPLVTGCRRIVDLGSGAGFPGLILACALGDEAEVTLIEATQKKCAFLRAAGDAAGLRIDVRQSRIEAVSGFPADVITARALAPLPKLLELSAPWTQQGAFCVFPKGSSVDEDVRTAQRAWDFQLSVRKSRTSSTGRILKLWEVRRRG